MILNDITVMHLMLNHSLKIYAALISTLLGLIFVKATGYYSHPIVPEPANVS
jgi:hypothetical protein